MNFFDPIFGPVDVLPPLCMVNASAGTGKTWTVTHLAARWLIECEGRDPSNVLMVTFARDAAGELRSRLREKLEEFSNEIVRFEAGERLRDDDENWIEHFREVLKSQGSSIINSRCQNSIRNIGEVNARTIHSFASLVQFGQESTTSNSKEMCRRAAREALTWMAEDNSSNLNSLLEQINVKGDKTNRLADQIARALEISIPMGGVNREKSLVHFSPAQSVTDENSIQVRAILTFQALVVKAQEFEERLRKVHQSSSFNSVIGTLVNEIHNDIGSVRRRMGDQFELVIIDEFQDTDAAQWDIFSSLFLNGAKKVPIIVVGDAKQAIYSFRGGDVSVMQRIQKIIDSDDSMMSSSLEMNYRSHSGLLNQLNQFYSPEGVSHEFIPPSEGLSGIYYEQVLSPPHLNDGKGLFTLRDLRKVSLNGDNREALIKDVVLEIQRLTSDVLLTEESNKNRENWSYSDIAVLCRTKRFLQDLQYELGRHHIPYVVPRTISVFSSIAASQVRWLLWTLDNPTDLRRWRSLGASWFFSLLTSSDGPNELVAAISKKGFSELQRSVMSKEFANFILSHPGGQRNFTDIEHIFAVIADEFPSFNGLSEVLQWIENAITDADTQNDEVDGQRRIESDENAVRLMTMHAAKGLEFPVVLLPNLETTGQDPLVCTDNHEYGRTIDSLSVLLDSTGRKALSARSCFEESDRLIYVALTRATNVLIGWLNDDMSPLRTPAWLSLSEPWADRRFEGGPLVVKVKQEELASAEIRFGTLNNEHLKNVSVIEQKRSIREPYRRWSYSNIHLNFDNPIFEGQDNPSSSEDDDSSIVEIQKGRRGFYTFGNLRGADLGNALHATFEDVIGKIESNDEDALYRTIKKHFKRYGLIEPHDVVPVFQRLLNRPLGAVWGNQSLNSYKDATQKTTSEMRFTMPLTSVKGEADVLIELAKLVVENDPDGPFKGFFESLLQQPSQLRLSQGFLSGSIDLVAPTLVGKRQYMVLDYKSNGLTSTNDFSYNSLSVEMASSGYPLQALIYSVALHRHLTARLPDYEPHRHLGGATYYYLRGAGLSDAQADEGIFHWSIPPELTKKASSCLRGDSI